MTDEDLAERLEKEGVMGELTTTGGVRRAKLGERVRRLEVGREAEVEAAVARRVAGVHDGLSRFFADKLTEVEQLFGSRAFDLKQRMEVLEAELRGVRMALQAMAAAGAKREEKP